MLGNKIRELRESRDISLRELAKNIVMPEGNAMSAAFLSDIELGRRFPKDVVLEKIAAALDTTYDILKDSDTRAPVKELK